MNMKTEPAVTVGLVSTAVAAVLVCVVAFGLPITDTQQSAVLGVIGGVWPLVTAILIRPKVYAPDTVANLTGTKTRVDGAAD